MIGTEGIPSLFTTLASSAKPVCAPDPLDPTTLPETELTQAGLQTVRMMLNAGWPVQNVVRGSVKMALQVMALWHEGGGWHEGGRRVEAEE